MTRILLMLATLLLLLTACTEDGQTALEGRLLYEGKPLAQAQLEIYLKAGKDRSTAPFMVATTDEAGRYRLQLPAGSYFFIGKKKIQTSDGRTRMLMADCPTNPIEAGKGLEQVPPFSLQVMGDDGGLVPDPGTSVSGRVVHDGRPLGNAWVYVYTDDVLGLIGPSYGAAAQTGADGRYLITLPAGRFFLAARFRGDGARFGEPEAGDLNGTFAGNPVQIRRGQAIDLMDLQVRPVDREQLQRRQQQGSFGQSGTALSGEVLDQDGNPVPGVYVFAYLDSRMVGKPNFISAPSDQEGRFEIPLTAAGTYFVGARSSFGGPLEPGEWVGTYEGRPDHGAEVEAGKKSSLGAITVREVW